jgi:hypothetical protein
VACNATCGMAVDADDQGALRDQLSIQDDMDRAITQ